MNGFPLHVAAHERDVLRLFGVDTTASEAQKLLSSDRDAALAAALGVPHLDVEWVELVARRDIAELGLPGYLAAGYDVPAAQLESAADRLAEAPAHVLIVPSRAFGETEWELRPGRALRPIVAFDLSEPLPERLAMLPRSEAGSDLASPRAAPAAKRRPTPFAFGLLAAAAAAALLLLAVWVLA